MIIGRTKKKRPSRVLGLTLAAILAGGPSLAMAQQLQVSANTEASLDLAIDVANDTANQFSGTEIQIADDITGTPLGTADSVVPRFWIYGDLVPNGIAGTTISGDITVKGMTTGGAQYTLGYDPGSSAYNSPVLGIINTTGNVAVENLRIQGGKILNANVGDGDYYSGAGLYIGAVNTTIDLEDTGRGSDDLTTASGPFAEARLTNVTLTNNHIEITTSAGDVAAAGGGLFIDGSDYSHATQRAAGEVTLTGVNAINNSVKITGIPGVTGSTIQGGGIRVKNVVNLTYAGGQVTDNIAHNVNGNNSHGGGMSFDDNSINGTITNVTLARNKAIVEGAGTATSHARGGGLFVINEKSDARLTDTTTVTLSNVMFDSNAAQAKGGGNAANGGAFAMLGDGAANFSDSTFQNNKAITEEGARYASGGAIHTEAFGAAGSPIIKITDVTFSGNETQAQDDAGQARGGAIHTVNDLDAASADNAYLNNKALAGPEIGSNGTSSAYGGAIYSTTNLTTVGDTYTGNEAGTFSANGTAFGGALYAQGAINVRNAEFTGNKALASNGGKAYGGGMYAASGQSHTVTNSSFIANEATTAGGAIFVDTKSGSTSTLTLDATASGDKIVISGNTAGGKADGIYFGSSDLTNTAAGRLNITGQGLVKLLDPVTADLNNQAFTFNKSNTGELHWGGTNVLNSGTGGSNINLTQGKTVFTNDFTVNVGAGGSALKVNVAGGGNRNELGFDTSRSNNLAIFDYTGTASTSYFSAYTNTTVSVYGAQDGGRQILDISGSYILAANTEGHAALDAQLRTAKNNMTAGQGVTGFEVDNNNLMVNVDYDNPEQDRLRDAGANTWSGRFALQELVSAEYGVINDDEFAAIRRNYSAVTSEYGMVQGRVSLDTTTGIFEKARLTGLNNYWKTRNGESVPSAGGSEGGFRAWAGYIGNFQNTDRDGGYLGYKADTNGAIFGLSYDFSEGFSLGLMGGVTSGTTELDRIKSEVDSDGVHIGLMGSISPPAVPALGLYFDLGYSGYENDGFRKLDGYKTTGSFDQDVFTAGLGAEYIFNAADGTLISPYLNLRYLSLDQDGYRERGLTASRVSGYDIDSFTSELGVKLSREIVFDGGSFTPHLNLGWRHEYADRKVDARSNYLNPSTGGLMPTSFNLSTVSVDRDMANIGVGGDFMFDMGNCSQFGFTIDYNVLTSGSQTNQSVYGGLEYRF